jgi:hypothetical protein
MVVPGEKKSPILNDVMINTKHGNGYEDRVVALEEAGITITFV